MITWILILTLYTDGYKSGGGSVAAISGFSSKAECVAAGNAWTAAQRTEHQRGRSAALDRVDTNVICVKQTKGGPNG